MITIREALRKAREQLSESDTPDLDAQLLFAFALDVERVHLLAHGDESPSCAGLQKFEVFLKRRFAGEPIAYITGRKWFYDLEFLVTSSVLIPRPETELLLEEAMRLLSGSANAAVADIGTGCGALAITFKRHMPSCRVYAVDIDAEALQIARKNSQMHDASVAFLRGDLTMPLQERSIEVDLLMANLPYIATDELNTLAVSRFEPRRALDGGPGGLGYIRRLLPQIPQVCGDGAWVLLEIGAGQGDAVALLVEETLGLTSTVLPDYAGHDRIVRFQFRRQGLSDS